MNIELAFPLLHPLKLWSLREYRGGSAFKAAVAEALKRMHRANSIEEGEALSNEIANVREEHFNRYLRSQRLTRLAIIKKKELLATPLDAANPVRHYLLGYLAIKGLYARRPAASPLRMSTLFHLGAQARIFHDPVVAHGLVSIEDLDVNKVQLTCSRLVNHLQDRLDDFTVNNRAVLMEIQAITTGQQKELELQLQLRCMMRMGRDAHPLAPKYLAFRHVFRYATTSVRLEHGAHMVVIRSMDGEPLGACPRVPNSDDAVVGTLEIAATPNGSDLALVILTADGLVATRCLRSGHWNLPEHVALFDDLPSADVAHAYLQKRIAGVLPDAAPTGPVADAMKATACQLEKFAEHVLLNLAFPLEAEQRLHAMSALTRSGFAGLFPGGKLIELAKYSLIFSGEGLTIAAGAELEKISAESCVRRIAEFNTTAQEAIGLPLFEVTSGQVATSLI